MRGYDRNLVFGEAVTSPKDNKPQHAAITMADCLVGLFLIAHHSAYQMGDITILEKLQGRITKEQKEQLGDELLHQVHTFLKSQSLIKE